MKKIFIGLEEIAGYNCRLKLGFDELGVSSSNISLTEHRYKYSNNDDCGKIVQIICAKRSKISREITPINIYTVLSYYFLLVVFFLSSLFKYDTFIFSFMSSFFCYCELPILKLFRKKIIYVFLGSDSRPYYINRRCFDVSAAEIVRRTRRQKAAIRKIERYADVIINHPPSAHFHERNFISFMKIGFPFSCNVVHNHPNGLHSHKVRILHAPSHFEGKGTSAIRSAISDLRGKGYYLEYIEIIDSPNSVVLAELSQCDFVIDELYSDAVMAGFATEAAFYGKPAVVGSYATLEDIGNLPVDSIPPVHHCHPDEIETAIEKLIVDEVYRKDLGARAKQFVNMNWSARSVAERYLRIIEGKCPEDWFHDPRDIRYLHGWGLQESQAQMLVRKVIDYGGLSALQLGDKPELANGFYSFAFSSDKHDQAVY